MAPGNTERSRPRRCRADAEHSSSPRYHLLLASRAAFATRPLTLSGKAGELFSLFVFSFLRRYFLLFNWSPTHLDPPAGQHRMRTGCEVCKCHSAQSAVPPPLAALNRALHFPTGTGSANDRFRLVQVCLVDPVRTEYRDGAWRMAAAAAAKKGQMCGTGCRG